MDATNYHTIISPTLHVSKDPKIPIPVGILACQRTVASHLITTEMDSGDLGPSQVTRYCDRLLLPLSLRPCISQRFLHPKTQQRNP